MVREPGGVSICFLLAMYRNAESVREFVTHLRSLPRPIGMALDVLVVDNSGGAGAIDIPGALVFNPVQNLGYMPGCAWALARWRDLGGAQPAWICVSNTDLRLDDSFLVNLAQSVLEIDTGVLAPDVRLRNGAQQNPILHRRPRRAMILAYAVLSRISLFMPIFEFSVRTRHFLRGLFGRRGASTERSPIYAAHGSIFLVHRRFFERGGRLDYRAKMYGEEIHIAEQARRAGLRVIWMGDLRAVHDEHATTRSVPWPQRRRWHAESAGVLWNDYFVERA